MIVNLQDRYVILTPPKTGGGGLAAAGLGVSVSGPTLFSEGSQPFESFSNNVLPHVWMNAWFGKGWKGDEPVTFYVTTLDPVQKVYSIYKTLRRDDEDFDSFSWRFLGSTPSNVEELPYYFARKPYTRWMEIAKLPVYPSIWIKTIRMDTLEESLEDHGLKPKLSLPAKKRYTEVAMKDSTLLDIARFYRTDASRFGYANLLDALAQDEHSGTSEEQSSSP